VTALHSLFTLTLALSRSREREFRLPLLSEERVGVRSDATCLVPWLISVAMPRSIRLGSTEELLVAGVRDGFLTRESDRVGYPLEGKSYRANPEERVRAALYAWLRRRYPDAAIRLEENRHDLRCTDLGLDMLIECKARHLDSQEQLRTHLAKYPKTSESGPRSNADWALTSDAWWIPGRERVRV